MRENCAECGAPIPEERKRSNAVKYCSEACQRKAGAKKNITAIASRAVRMNKVAQAVYVAYDAKCALCGWQATPELIEHNGKMQYAHGNEIHHILSVRDGGTEAPDNLILLCPNHHKQADLGLISQEELKCHTVNFQEVASEQKHEVRLRSQCESAVANAIFDEGSIYS